MRKGKEKTVKTYIRSRQQFRCRGCGVYGYFFHFVDEDPVGGSWKCVNSQCSTIHPFRLFNISREADGGRPFVKGMSVRLLTNITQASSRVLPSYTESIVDVRSGSIGVIEEVGFEETPGNYRLDILWDNKVRASVNQHKVDMVVQK